MPREERIRVRNDRDDGIRALVNQSDRMHEKQHDVNWSGRSEKKPLLQGGTDGN